MKSLAPVILVFVLMFSPQADAQKNKRQSAADAVVRLKPAMFKELPKSIVSYLNARGCNVPQTFAAAEPHNAIRGEFAEKGQIDWAVLCSRNRVSSILVFWNGSTKSVAEIARAADKDFLQTTSENGKVGFSRAIGVVKKDFILEHYSEYGGLKPVPIKHQGINDAIIEKASSVHYFYRKRWLELQGAD